MTQKITRYPGAKPFTIEYKDLFFGRDRDIDRFSRLIQVEKLTVLYGKSGLGKSSLLNAGVLPQLKNTRPIFIRFYSFSESNRRQPLLARCHEILAEYDGDSPLARIADRNDSLWLHLKDIQWRLQRDNDAKTTLHLIFDQFEELFTYPAEDYLAFAAELADALNNRQPRDFSQALEQTLRANPDFLSDDDWRLLESDLPLNVIFSIRSDRMNLLNRLTPHLPQALRHCYELKPLEPDAAREAIEKPAQLDLAKASTPETARLATSPSQGLDDQQSSVDPADLAKGSDETLERGEQKPSQGVFLSPAFAYDPALSERILAYLTGGGQKEIESFQLQIICDFVEKIVLETGQKLVPDGHVPQLDQVYHSYYLNLIEQLPAADRPTARRLIEDGLIFEAEERRLSLYEGQITDSFGVSPVLLRQLVDSRLLRSEPNPGGGFNYELCHDSLVKPILLAKEKRLAAEREAAQKRLEAEREAKRQDELRQAREEAEREQARRLRDRRRSQIVIAIVSLFALISLGLAIWAVQSKREANQARKEAQAQLDALKQSYSVIVRNTLRDEVPQRRGEGRYAEVLAALDEAATLNVEQDLVRFNYAEIAFIYSHRPDSLAKAGAIMARFGPVEGRDGQSFRESLRKLVGEEDYTRLTRKYYGDFVAVPGDTFMMGAPEDEAGSGGSERPVHKVRLSPFQISRYEMTVAQYRLFCLADSTVEMLDPEGWGWQEDAPIINVSWYEAVRYANWLNGLRGLPPPMTEDAGLKYPGQKGYRLPTEAEWEYACRAGTTTPFNLGPTITTNQVNYYGAFEWRDNIVGEYRKRTIPVGSLNAPNAWGLHDMHGNVYEWCADWYGAYPNKFETNPVGPAVGSNRVIRGGSWYNSGRNCRSADRLNRWPGIRYRSVGFRLVFVP